MLRRGSLPRRLAATAVATALLATAGCGPSNEDPDPVTGPAEIVEVTVGVIPIVDVAPIYLGKEKGFFRERGIDLKMTTAPGGAAILPGVVSGQFDFGFSNMITLLTAQTRKAPIQVVASGVASTGEQDLDFGAVVVKANSPIKEPKDLAGRKVAINSAKNISDVVVRESVRKDGGDAKDINFVEMPFPQMQAALMKGDVEAAFVVEPFLAQARGANARVVAWSFADAAKELTVSGWFTSSKLMQDDADLVTRFVDAINESMQFANGQPGQVRSVLTSYMRIEQVVLDSMTLPYWPSKINRESVNTLARLGKADGLFGNAEPDVDKLLPPAS
jgi:NitT/TauT family transport system substrate-binding protein